MLLESLVSLITLHFNEIKKYENLLLRKTIFILCDKQKDNGTNPNTHDLIADQ